MNEYHRGIAFVAVKPELYLASQSDRALDQIVAIGANYISLFVVWFQNDRHSTDIHRTKDTASDEQLVHVIDYAHAHGLRVLLKPHLNLSNESPDHWFGEIEFPNSAGWQTWFASYRDFVLYYARLAQRHGVEEFSLGNELVSTTSHTSEWRDIIRAARTAYTGLLTYSANHTGEESRIEFWDQLDYIGVNSFYHLTNYRQPSIDQLLAGWRKPVLMLTALHSRFPSKPIIFTEGGYASIERANVWPWMWNTGAPVDMVGQANAYEALFRTWWKNPDRPWFRGMYIWNWFPDPNYGGTRNRDFTPHDKPAEAVLKAWFSDNPLASPYNPRPGP